MTSGSLAARLRGWLTRNRSIGFGLEHLGFLTLRHPRIVGLVVILFTALCASQLPRISVDGDLMRVFASSGPYYDSYQRLTETFGTFEDDAYILVNTDKLTDPAVIETLRELSFDLELNEFSIGTMSPFSLRKPGPDGGTVPAVDEGMTSPEQVETVLSDLRENDPTMRNLILEDLNGLVMIMFPNDEMVKSPGGLAAMIANLRELVAKYNTPEVKVQLTGPPIWTTEILEASNADQARFTIFGFLVGAVISLVAIRSVIGALLASLAPVLAVVWVIGTTMLVFGSFTFLTNIVVTLVLVIAFAESMYFCFTWLRLWNEGLDGYAAIEEATRRVLPAAALTTLTTMVSFGTLMATQGRGIEEFGLSGLIGVGLAFVCFATFMPLVMRLAVRLGFKPPRKMSIAVTAPIPVARYSVRHFAKPLAVLSVAAVLLMLIPHFQMQPSFSFEDYMPTNSTALETARGIDEGVGGVAPIYVSVPLADRDPAISDGDFERVRRVHEIVETHVGKNKVISAVTMSGFAEAGYTRAEIFDAVGPFMQRRFVSEDAGSALITAFLPTIMDSDVLKSTVNDIEGDLAAAGFTGVEVGGYRLMTSFASDDIINSIRTSLMWAIVINIFLIALAFRSIRIGIVSVIPNLLPILGTELYLYFSGAGLQITSVIALTVAFGIAVDDTIHFLSTYLRHRDNGEGHFEAIDISLERVGPALVATTLILCAGTAVVMFSALPPVALFGTLLVLTLVIALLGDLFILPALMVALPAIFDPFAKRAGSAETATEKVAQRQ